METEKNTRYHLIDGIRGIVLVSMILFHGSWNLVYIYGLKWPWYHSRGAYIWQQSICWTFILLSGFCWSMSRNHVKRGLLVFGSGLLVTAVTLAVMPENRVVFGVLTCIGSSMLLMIMTDKIFCKIPAYLGLFLAVLLFVVTRDVNYGYLGFEKWHLCDLPQNIYQNNMTAYLGMPPIDFFSTDYFSIIPWFFLFTCGYFLYHLLKQTGLLKKEIFTRKVLVFDWLGKHSLLLYLLHQPILYLIMEFMNGLGMI